MKLVFKRNKNVGIALLNYTNVFFTLTPPPQLQDSLFPLLQDNFVFLLLLVQDIGTDII